MSGEHAERREHLRRLLDDVSSQRKVDPDEMFTELIHVVLELHEAVEGLAARVERVEERLSAS